jgi:hypothetical protein
MMTMMYIMYMMYCAVQCGHTCHGWCICMNPFACRLQEGRSRYVDKSELSTEFLNVFTPNSETYLD